MATLVSLAKSSLPQSARSNALIESQNSHLCMRKSPAPHIRLHPLVADLSSGRPSQLSGLHRLELSSSCTEHQQWTVLPRHAASFTRRGTPHKLPRPRAILTASSNHVSSLVAVAPAATAAALALEVTCTPHGRWRQTSTQRRRHCRCLSRSNAQTHRRARATQLGLSANVSRAALHRTCHTPRANSIT